MLKRRLCVRTPHNTVATRNWSTAPRFREFRFLRRSDHISRPGQQQQQQQQRGTYNYAPQGKPPYYNYYVRATRPRSSRLKDMAIGSALTIAVFLAWQFYGYLQFKKKVEPFEIFPYIKDHMRRYDTLLKEAEERGYGPESIRGVVVERALALAFALEMCTEDPVRQRPRELGPLPRFHKSMPYYGMEKIEDQETLVLLNPVPAITRPLPQVNAPSNGRKPADTERLHEILITVNVSGEDLERTADEKSSTPKEAGAIDPTRSMWDEVRWRSGMVIDKLYAIGMFEKDKRVMVIIMARDDLRAYTYSDGCFERIIIDEPHTSGVSR